MDDDEVVVLPEVEEELPSEFNYWFVGKPNSWARIYRMDPEGDIGEGEVVVFKSYAKLINTVGYRILIYQKAGSEDSPEYDVTFLNDTESLYADYGEQIRILRSQNKAISDRNDFLEDCIAEMASIVYNSEIAMQALNN